MSEALTIEKLQQMVEEIKGRESPPFLASHSLLCVDKAMRFRCHGRTYIGAAPEFWEEVRRAAVERHSESLASVTIFILDGELGATKCAEFYRAMAEAMGFTSFEGRA